MMITGILTAAAIALTPTQQAAVPVPQSAPQTAPPLLPPQSADDVAEVGDVLVEAQRSQEAAARFIERIGAPASSRRLDRRRQRRGESCSQDAHGDAPQPRGVFASSD